MRRLGLVVFAVAAAAAPIHGHVQVPDAAALDAQAPVALGFFDAQRAVLSQRGGMLLVSDDGGSSWRPDGRPRFLHIDVVGPRTAFATSATALFRTDDAGARWQRVAPIGGTISFADASHGWIVDGRKAWTTSDGGRTLVPLHTPCMLNGAESIALARVTTRLGFAVCAQEPGAGSQRKELFVTEDGGRSWRLRTGPEQMPIGGYLGSVSFSDARDGLLTTDRGSGLLATADGGRSWRTILQAPDSDVVAAQHLGRDTVVALLEDGALYRSTDGGRRRRLLYPHTLPTPAAVAYSTPVAGIGAGYADWGYASFGILATTDAGRSWHVRALLPQVGSAATLERVSGGVVFLTGTSSHRVGMLLLRSTDDGRTWSAVPVPAGAGYFGVSFLSASDGILAEESGRFYATSDGGRHWRRVHGRGPDLRTFAFLTASLGFALSAPSDPALYVSRDGGRHWRPDPHVPVERPVALATLGAKRVWLVDVPVCSTAPTCPAAIVRSSDGGRTWERIALNAVPGVQTYDFVTASVGYAGDAPLGYRTTDGGRDWTLIR